jgi:hypothetical protein
METLPAPSFQNDVGVIGRRADPWFDRIANRVMPCGPLAPVNGLRTKPIDRRLGPENRMQRKPA